MSAVAVVVVGDFRRVVSMPEDGENGRGKFGEIENPKGFSVSGSAERCALLRSSFLIKPKEKKQKTVG